MSKRYQVVGIGNAVVDVITNADDSFLDHMGITKGIMQLVERDRSETLFAAMDDRQQIPGGSVGNTIAGAGNLGLNTAFVGRVGDDALGLFYRDALTEAGTDFPNPPVKNAELPTSRSMIFVSFKTLIADHLDYVIGNEHELKSLWETEDLEEALEKTSAICDTVVCTQSGNPVILIQGDTRVEVPVKTVVPVDATGAGDQFAAGFLYGMSQKLPLTTCGRMGCVAAAEVISHIGARPETDLMTLFKEQGLV